MRESVLIMHSAARVGDTLANEICEFLREAGSPCLMVNSDLPSALDKLNPEDCKPSVVIVLESMDAFISHRLRIGGRPWVLAASFTFDDVYSLYSNTLAITEIGIDSFVSNCLTFLKNMTSMIPSRFCWRPVPKLRDLQQMQNSYFGNLIGTVLDNVFDRDFSLVDHAFKVLEEHDLSDKAVVYCHERVDRSKLPPRLATYAVDTPGAAAPSQDIPVACKTWGELKYYLVAPRITDLRGGIIPSEILKALTYGRHPLCFAHNALPGLGRIFTPQFTSLKSFEASLLDAARGKFKTRIVGPASKHEHEWQPTVKDFCEMVEQMYRRFKANASA